MSTIAQHFSSIDYIKRLRGADFSQAQAEVLAKENEQLIVNILEQAYHEVEQKDLATKLDLKEQELRLIKWITGTGLAGIIAIAGLLKFMIH